MKKVIFLFMAVLLSFLTNAQDKIPPFDYNIDAQNIRKEYNKDSTLVRLFNDQELLNGTYKILLKDSVTAYGKAEEGYWNGTYSTYYKTGEIKSIIPYDKGIKRDTGLWYFKKGPINRKTPYKDGLQHGTSVWYYNNGQPLKECGYINGKEHGVCHWYFKKGHVKWLVTYTHGVKNGLVEKYKFNGDLEFRGYFLNNKQVTKTIFEGAKKQPQ